MEYVRIWSVSQFVMNLYYLTVPTVVCYYYYIIFKYIFLNIHRNKISVSFFNDVLGFLRSCILMFVLMVVLFTWMKMTLFACKTYFYLGRNWCKKLDSHCYIECFLEANSQMFMTTALHSHPNVARQKQQKVAVTKSWCLSYWAGLSLHADTKSNPNLRAFNCMHLMTNWSGHTISLTVCPPATTTLYLWSMALASQPNRLLNGSRCELIRSPVELVAISGINKTWRPAQLSNRHLMRLFHLRGAERWEMSREGLATRQMLPSFAHGGMGTSYHFSK